MTRPPNWVPGIGFLTEPVAMITQRLATISEPSKLPPTRTLPSSVTAPWPEITSMPFFLNRPATPPVSVLMTFLRRSETAPKSTSWPLTLMPNSPASSTSVRMSAERRTAFAGMHA